MSKLVVFCGIDGSGKTTQIQLLTERLVRMGLSHVVLKQPSNWFRENKLVRQRLDVNDKSVSPRFLSLFSAADRILQVEKEILPQLNCGTNVIMDRYVYSAYAYMQARGLEDYDWLKSINKFVPLPDFTFFIDVAPEIALSRIIERGGSSKAEEQDLAFMAKVRENYLAMAEEHNFVIIDGTLDCASIADKIISVLEL